MILKEQISTTVGNWISEQDLPVRADLKALRINDLDHLLTEAEIEDRNEFIRCYILQDLEVLMLIPKPNNDREFFVEGWEESVFNTIDFYRMHKPRAFSHHHYRIEEILERVRHLAITYSIIQSCEGLNKLLNQFKALVKKQFKNKIRDLAHQYRKTSNPEKQEALMDKIAENQRCVMECQKIWEQYAPRDI